MMDNNNNLPKQQSSSSSSSLVPSQQATNQANSSTGSNDYSTGDYSSSQQQQQQHDATNDLYSQHQISTTVTSNRPSLNAYGGNVQTINSSGNNSNPSSGNPYKLKQQRNYVNRYDPMGAQTATFSARNAAATNAAAQLQGPWGNGVSAAAVAAAQSQFGGLAAGNPFGLPHHYPQQTVDMYANYYGAPQQTSYAPPGAQQSAYGQYGQQMIPPESPKGGHVVYVYGIGQRATQEEIFALFQPFGRVLRVDIIIDFNTGLCKGYAFVAMEQYQEAQLAVQSLNAAPFHGRQLQVRFKT